MRLSRLTGDYPLHPLEHGVLATSLELCPESLEVYAAQIYQVVRSIWILQPPVPFILPDCEMDEMYAS